jgi:hypothetical protein
MYLPACSGTNRTVFTVSGRMSVRIFNPGQLNPCILSSVVNSSTTGIPFFTVITLGEYSYFFAVTLITCSFSARGQGGADKKNNEGQKRDGP